jgi:RecA/RadA recombinase
MSTYTITSEPENTAPADADEILISDAGTGRTQKIGIDTLRQYMHAGLVDVTAATVTITAAEHAGRTVTLNRAAGIAATLPAATGSGNKYKFVVGTTFSGAATIKVVGNDTMIGTATLYADGGATVVGFAAGGTDDTVTFAADNSTGGVAGAMVELQDIKADLWHVNVVSDAAGSEVTPFSATVAP